MSEHQEFDASGAILYILRTTTIAVLPALIQPENNLAHLDGAVIKHSQLHFSSRIVAAEVVRCVGAKDCRGLRGHTLKKRECGSGTRNA